jgi:hypothetical protein
MCRKERRAEGGREFNGCVIVTKETLTLRVQALIVTHTTRVPCKTTFVPRSETDNDIISLEVHSLESAALSIMSNGALKVAILIPHKCFE